MATYGFETIREVRLNIDDRDTTSPHFTDSDISLFLDRASGNVNGGSAYALQALAAMEARAWASVNVGGISRSKANPAAALMELAKQYAAQSSGTAVLDDAKFPVFGIARPDWKDDTDLEAQRRRQYAEAQEDD